MKISSLPDRTRPRAPFSPGDPWLVAWVFFVTALAVGTAAFLTVRGGYLGNPPLVIALAVIAALAERQRIRLRKTLEESITLVPILFTAVTFGAFAALIVGSASYASHLRRPYLKWVTYTSSRALIGA